MNMKKGNKLSVTIQSGKTFITAETPNFVMQSHTPKSKDENLKILGYIHNYTFWYNENDDSFWLSTYNAQLKCHTNWRELKEHDKKLLYTFGLASRLDYRNPFPDKIRLRKGDKLRLRRFLDRIEGKKVKK